MKFNISKFVACIAVTLSTFNSPANSQVYWTNFGAQSRVFGGSPTVLGHADLNHWVNSSISWYLDPPVYIY